MRMRKWLLLSCLVSTTNAYAVGGAGDVVWDPKLEAQVIAVYKQTVELYNNAKSQLQTAAEMNKTIYEAEQAYDAIVNFDMQATAQKMFGFNSSQGAEGRWKIQGLLNDLNRMESTGRNKGRFFAYQTGRLENMQAMFDYQEQAAEKMNVSRQTFGRIIESAHKKIADALVNGKALSIEGGIVELDATAIPEPPRRFRRGHGGPGRHGRGFCGGR